MSCALLPFSFLPPVVHYKNKFSICCVLVVTHNSFFLNEFIVSTVCALLYLSEKHC